MTTASELFYNRRSRFGRNSHDLALDSPPSERSFHHSPTSGRRGHHFIGSGAGGNHRHDFDACDPLRRYPHARNGYGRASHQDRAGFRIEEFVSHGSSLGNRVDTENLISTSRAAIAANDRLPGSVLLARARLCERLRGLPLSGSRSRSSVSSNTSSGDLWPDEDSRPFNPSDWETANFISWSNSAPRSTNSGSQTVRQRLLQHQNKKPTGLTQEVLDCLQLELFTVEETEPEQKEPTVSRSQDCSICLDSYVPGDELVRLSCEHRFHASCVHPWLRICGDCPCCRRAMTVKKKAGRVLWPLF